LDPGYKRKASRTKLPLSEEVKAALIAHHRDDLGARGTLGDRLSATLRFLNRIAVTSAQL